MQNVNHQNCGEYRYCPERHGEVVSLPARSTWQDGLRFSIKGTKIRVGYFFRIAGLIGKAVRKRIAGLGRRCGVLTKMGYRPLDIRRVSCCARL